MVTDQKNSTEILKVSSAIGSSVNLIKCDLSRMLSTDNVKNTYCETIIA